MRVDGLPWDAAQTERRKRAALALAALAFVALLLVGVMLLVLNKSGNSGAPGQAPPPPATDIRSGVPSSPASARRSSAPTRPRTAPPTRARPRPAPHHTAVVLTCTGTPACVLPGDPGGVLQALNAYRRSQGSSPVRGGASGPAQTCAVNNGDGGSCPRSYFWEPVTGHDGGEVISKIAANPDGRQFLLDPQVRSVQIGWAYLPSSRGYECAVINVY